MTPVNIVYFLFKGGRDAQQNELIVKRYMKSGLFKIEFIESSLKLYYY